MALRGALTHDDSGAHGSLADDGDQHQQQQNRRRVDFHDARESLDIRARFGFVVVVAQLIFCSQDEKRTCENDKWWLFLDENLPNEVK